MSGVRRWQQALARSQVCAACDAARRPSVLRGPRLLASFVLLVALGACTAVQTYEGERREREEVARVSGDLPFSAGAPVSVILRQVDGRRLKLGESTVELLPGEHQLLVDCRVAETNDISRHVLEVDVSAGRQYRLVAELAPGLRECSTVTVERVN